MFIIVLYHLDNFALSHDEMDLIDISIVTLFDKEYLIVESANQTITKLTYFTYVADKLRNVFESVHMGTQNTVSMHLLDRSCVGFFTEYVSQMLRLECALFNRDGRLYMELVGVLEAPAQLVQVSLFCICILKRQSFVRDYIKCVTIGIV